MAEFETNTIHTGDAFDVLPTLPSEAAHAIVTDPPYGLAFMGRDWDDFEPKEYQEWCERWASIAMEPLKPGGHLLAFSGNRTHHRLMSGVEDAGFEIRDTITWHYGSGFPKALDVSKAIDKAAGAEREVVGVKPGHEEFAGRETTGHLDGKGGGSEGWRRPWQEADDADRYHMKTAPATDAAKEWDGWKTALKPATEFVVLARKPFEGTVAENVQAHGTGALNINGCLVEGSAPEFMDFDGDAVNDYSDGLSGSERTGETVDGRYPPNVILDEYAAEAMDRRVGELSGGARTPQQDAGSKDVYDGGYGDADRGHDRIQLEGGGPSRYYTVHDWDAFARAWNQRYLYTSKATAAERTLDGRIENAHPTVKPKDLMEWLVKLVTKEDQVVLDPFAGTGTTAAACKALNRRFVAIEKDEQWADVARVRCNLTPNDPSIVRADADAQQGLEAFNRAND